MKAKVFLIAADPDALRVASSELYRLNALYLRPVPWVLPWPGALEGLREKLRDASAGLGDRAVIAELDGGDFHA